MCERLWYPLSCRSSASFFVLALAPSCPVPNAPKKGNKLRESSAVLFFGQSFRKSDYSAARAIARLSYSHISYPCSLQACLTAGSTFHFCAYSRCHDYDTWKKNKKKGKQADREREWKRKPRVVELLKVRRACGEDWKYGTKERAPRHSAAAVTRRWREKWGELGAYGAWRG